jgi:transposase
LRDLPGAFSQHDFGQRRVQYTDGRIEVVRFFASRLKYSRYVDVQVVDNEQQETVVRCLLTGLRALWRGTADGGI